MLSTLKITERLEIQKSVAVEDWEADDIEPEEPVCSFFGCGKKLKLVEQLCGDRCLDHKGKEQDIMNSISV